MTSANRMARSRLARSGSGRLGGVSIGCARPYSTRQVGTPAGRAFRPAGVPRRRVLAGFDQTRPLGPANPATLAGRARTDGVVAVLATLAYVLGAWPLLTGTFGATIDPFGSPARGQPHNIDRLRAERGTGLDRLANEPADP